MRGKDAGRGSPPRSAGHTLCHGHISVSWTCFFISFLDFSYPHNNRSSYFYGNPRTLIRNPWLDVHFVPTSDEERKRGEREDGLGDTIGQRWVMVMKTVVPFPPWNIYFIGCNFTANGKGRITTGTLRFKVLRMQCTPSAAVKWSKLAI